ncbi:hypothetical protein D9M71_630320 [compost metagenome]
MHGLGHEQVRHFGRAAGILEHIDVVALHFGVQRRAELFPVGEQLVQGAGLEHRAGEDVGADFGAFFDHADADFFTGFGGLLLQAAGGGQARRAGADDDHVEFHVFAFHWFSPTHQGSCCCFVLWVRGIRSGSTQRRNCSWANDGLHRFVLAAHYIYTTWRVQYKRLFEFAAGQ